MADLLQFPSPAPSFPSFERPTAVIADTLSLSDPEAREAALDIRQSWIVEAPAGSGKTGLLIQRLLKLLAYGEIQRPGEILAITFTRKAAAELRTRVLDQLTAAAKGHPLPSTAGTFQEETRRLAEEVLARDRARGWNLLGSAHVLRIRTIDSFCAEVAQAQPLLSRGAAHRRPVEDARPLFEVAAERAVRTLGGPDPVLNDALRCLLLHRDCRVGDVVQLLADMLADREQWGTLVPLDAHALGESTLDGEVKARLEAALDRVICGTLSRAARLIGPQLLGELAGLAARLSGEPGYRGEISPIAFCAQRPHAPEAMASHLDHWRVLADLALTQGNEWRSTVASNHLKFEIPSSERPRIRDLLSDLRAAGDRRPGLREALCAVRTLPPAVYPDDQWRVAKALFRVLRAALLELNLLFAERGDCDFSEIALNARQLLRAEPDLLAHPWLQLSHLLVDEMQDTSAGQYELLELLTRHWDGGSQTVFLVGDPKQSIYAFRQARVERFLRTQAIGRLGEVPLRPLRLTANFRSQAALVAAFNRAFEQIMPAPEALEDSSTGAGEVPFVAALPARPEGQSPALHWHARSSIQAPGADEGMNEQPIDQQSEEDDARIIREIIDDFTERWQQRRLAPNELPRLPRVAVLARSRAHLAPVIAEFHKDRGRGPRPFRAVDIETLSERPEIIDLLSLSRALLHPGDRVAWLALLRSPICGLELADLLALTGEGASSSSAATVLHLVETRRHLLSRAGQRLLDRAWPVLAEAQENLGRTSFSTHIERTWRSLGADCLLAPEQAENARRFLALLQKLEQSPEPLSASLLQHKLEGLFAQPSPAEGAVELLTIHKAKGLEWDLVLIPSLERGAGRNDLDLLQWLELEDEDGAAAGVILAPIHSRGDDSSSLSRWLSRLQQSREAAEAKRLLYVACTRAREELHLFALCRRKRDGELATPRHDSLLRAGWPAAKPEMTEQLSGPVAVPLHSASFPAVAPSFVTAPPQELPLTLAAGAADPVPGSTEAPRITRLPAGFDPLARFRRDAGPQLAYTPAASLPRHPLFDRPEGSFAARAFGNAVHRFLELIADRLATGQTAEDLLGELPGWDRRLTATFRAEGLSPSVSAREAQRALDSLLATLRDPVGQWLLAPRSGAQSERSLRAEASTAAEVPSRTLRADRTFFAGEHPLSTDESHLWIVDFKTAEPGGRSPESFLSQEKAKYEPQLRSYARALTAVEQPAQPTVLALFYPSLTQMLHWTYWPPDASE